MNDKVWKAIKDFKMLENTNCVIIGVSGGIDSVCLLHFFYKNLSNLKIIAVHIDHNIRGEEGHRDAKFVEKLCKSWKIEFILGSFNVVEICKIEKKGIEETARKVRYKFFHEVSKKNSAKVATAHTLSDNLETVIFNFIRGSGLNGISGIPPAKENLIRPFIYITRQEIESYAKKNNLNYVIDSTNLSDLYSRNKIRHFIIPRMREINDLFEENAGRCIEQLRKENEFLNSVSKKEFLNINFNAEKIKILPIVIRNRVLKLILSKFDNNIEYKHIHLANRLLDGQINSFNLSKNRKVFIRSDVISCSELNNNDISEKKFYISKVDRDNFKEEFVKNPEVLFSLKNDISHYEFRTRKQGDIFHLPRRNCSKSLKKLFNEFKIPVCRRYKLAILEDKISHEIVWIESIGVSKNYEININSISAGKINILN